MSTNIGNAEVRVRIDTTAARSDIEAIENAERRQEGREGGRGGAGGGGGPGGAPGEGGGAAGPREPRDRDPSGRVTGPSAWQRGRDIAGRVIGTVRQMRDSDSVLRTAAELTGAALALIGPDELAKVTEAGLKAANVIEDKGPAAAAISMGLLERFTHGAVPDSVRKFVEDSVSEVASSVAELKATIDAVFGAGRDAATLGKAAFLMKSQLEPAELAKAYGNLFEVHKALQMSSRVQRMIEKRLYAEGLADAMAGSLQE